MKKVTQNQEKVIQRPYKVLPFTVVEQEERKWQLDSQ